MDRRDILKLGALATVGGSGCASLLSNRSAVGDGELSGFLTALDGAMAAIGTNKSFERYLPLGENPAHTARVNHAEELSKKTLRSLLLVGTVQELPPKLVAHDGVQQRLRDQMGEFDDAMFGMTSMLEGLSASDRAGVSKALRDDPHLGMRIMGSVDEEASAFGVSLKQRAKLRSLSAQACARLRQSPDLAIAEYTGKVRKVAARHGAREELERRASASIGASLIWQGEEAETRGTAGGELPALVPDAVERPCIESSECRPGFTCQDYKDLGEGNWSKGVCRPEPVVVKKRKSSGGLLTAGAIVMGLGATGFLIGAAGGSVGLLVGATVGAILGTIGLVTLILGLINLAVGN